MALENVIETHTNAGISHMVVTNTAHYIKGKAPEEQFRLVQRWDEYSAEVHQQYPDCTIPFAVTVPGGGDHYLRELERAVTQYGLKGVLINSSHEAHYPDEDEARGFFELVTALDIPVMVHAPPSSFGEECMNMYRLISSVGRPADETLALARLIVRGIYEQFPSLKLVGAHLGGGICEVIGRMDYAYELGDFCFFLGDYEPMLITKKPSEYMKMMYMDTASYWPPTLVCALLSIGADHLVFGSDAPPLAPLLPRAKQLIEEMDISDEEREMIFSGNALRLLNMTGANISAV
jgi:predicted TIM-barrel fold metal-dependent hydrolase